MSLKSFASEVSKKILLPELNRVIMRKFLKENILNVSPTNVRGWLLQDMKTEFFSLYSHK